MEAKVVGYEVDLGSLRATELRLGLPGTQDEPQKAASRGSKRTLQAGAEEESSSRPSSDCSAASGVVEHSPEPAPPAKAQVVGWPPIRSYRKNCLQAKKTGAEAPPGLYVKVSMDGAPYLRKMDLRSYSGYKELREAMETMFKCFSSTEGSCTSSEYVITYEDKDGDWMLAGDVPWEMFTSSCKRMRIMRGSEARGLGSAS